MFLSTFFDDTCHSSSSGSCSCHSSSSGSCHGPSSGSCHSSGSSSSSGSSCTLRLCTALSSWLYKNTSLREAGELGTSNIWTKQKIRIKQNRCLGEICRQSFFSLILTVPCIRNNHVMHQNMCSYIHSRRSTVHLVDTVVPYTNIHLLKNIIIAANNMLCKYDKRKVIKKKKRQRKNKWYGLKFRNAQFYILIN